MKLFSNHCIDIEQVDFSKWQTINGDYLTLENARTDYLDTCLEQLNYYMERYSAHVNYPVWERYAEKIEDILALRD